MLSNLKNLLWQGVQGCVCLLLTSVCFNFIFHVSSIQRRENRFKPCNHEVISKTRSNQNSLYIPGLSLEEIKGDITTYVSGGVVHSLVIPDSEKVDTNYWANSFWLIFLLLWIPEKAYTFKITMWKASTRSKTYQESLPYAQCWTSVLWGLFTKRLIWYSMTRNCHDDFALFDRKLLALRLHVFCYLWIEEQSAIFNTGCP